MKTGAADGRGAVGIATRKRLPRVSETRAYGAREPDETRTRLVFYTRGRRRSAGRNGENRGGGGDDDVGAIRFGNGSVRPGTTSRHIGRRRPTPRRDARAKRNASGTRASDTTLCGPWPKDGRVNRAGIVPVSSSDYIMSSCVRFDRFASSLQTRRIG